MKFICATVLSAACALPQLSWAADKAPITASTLGLMTGVVAFCGQINPSHRKQFLDKAEDLTRGLAEKEIFAMKNSADFKNVYVAIDGILHRLSRGDATEFCATVLK